MTKDPSYIQNCKMLLKFKIKHKKIQIRKLTVPAKLMDVTPKKWDKRRIVLPLCTLR